MTRLLTIFLACTWIVVRSGAPASAQIEAEDVNDAIRRAVVYLKGAQNKTRGGWTERPGHPGGVSALVTLALLNAGVEPSDGAIQRALAYLRDLGKPRMTYTTSLQTMVFCLATPEEDRLLIRRNVDWLEAGQVKGGPNKGAWAYSPSTGNGDRSNTQFAILALHEAERAGVRASDQTWRLALDYWLRDQKPDGSWSYFPDHPGTGSMTCAGIASLVICSDRLYEGDAKVAGDTVHCCGARLDNERLAKALDWLGQHFSVTRNPGDNLERDGARRHLFYYLYGVERVGRLTGKRFIVGTRGRHDWYREGAEMLVGLQDDLSSYWKGVGYAEADPLIATSFALLFLSKGRRPVVMAKLRHSDQHPEGTRAINDWDRHRGAVQRLTQHVERLWRRDLTWQIIDVRGAAPEDLIQSPVLFLTGTQALRLTEEQKKSLKIYIEQGGFLFAEACDGFGCDGEAFDRQFRALMAELFPNSRLSPLRPDHPIWRAEAKIDPDPRWPLLGLDASCRTAVVYCPRTLSCFWELSRRDTEDIYPQQVQRDIRYCLTVGANVLAYATNRQLNDKLDPPRIAYRESGQTPPGRGALHIPKLSHTGGADEAPNALANLLAVFHEETQMPTSAERRVLPATDEQWADYPLAFFHGRRGFRLSPEERSALQTYVERGGTLFGDAICASEPFAEAVKREFSAVFPQSKWRRIPPKHPLFSEAFGGFDLTTVSLRDPQLATPDDPLTAKIVRTAPLLEALEVDGRPAVIFSPYDLSCALESRGSLECKGYLKEDALKLGVNVILFVLQH